MQDWFNASETQQSAAVAAMQTKRRCDKLREKVLLFRLTHVWTQGSF